MPLSILSRVAPEHRQRLETPLSDGQRTALRTMLSAGLMRPALDDETKGALVAAGYGRETMGGFTLTDVGQVRAYMESGS
jgi:hypothetical protein